MLEKILLLIIFFSLTAGIGIYCRKKVTNVGSFVLGNRNIGPWMTAFAYGTSYFSAVVFVGYAGQFGWSFGISALWIGIGNALIGSLLAWLILGRRTRIMSNHFQASTMPDFFEKRYDSKAIKIIASIIIFIFLTPYSASVYKGLSGLFAMSFGIDFKYCITAMAAITGIYVVLGGYMAAAINDFIQGIIMLVGICLIIFSILAQNGGLIGSIVELSKIPCEHPEGMQGAYTSLFGPDPKGLLSVFILTSIGTWGLPQMVHKFYTINNEKSIKSGTVISTIFAFIIAGGSYFMGGFGRLFHTPDQNGINYDSIVPEMLSKTLPDLLIGVVLILVLSASMSTLASLVITSSSTFVLDFLKGTFFGKMKNKTQVVLIKLLCAGFILISVIIALNPNSLITSLMSLSWGALAGAFLGPFLYGLYFKGATRISVYASFVVGIGIVTINLFFPFASPTVAGSLSIISSFFVVPAVSLFTPKLKKETVENAFSCYEIEVTTKKVAVLESEENK
ncbi:MAG: sodium:solute symporter [Clostridia bacterium]|nr:sodium:solute symporter [Clostridia bacterium]